MYMQKFIDCIVSNGINNKLLQKMEDERNKFFESKRVNMDIVPVEIYKSWVRSKSAGVNPFNLSSALHIDHTKGKELAKYNQIVQKYGNFLNNIEDMTVNDKFVLHVFDKNFKSKYIKNIVNMPNEDFVGVDVGERIVGTTAPVIARLENSPAVVLKSMHYCQEFEMNCAAAPIHNEKEEIIGIFNIYFWDVKYAAEAYNIVKYSAKLFDTFCSSIRDTNDKYEKLLHQVIEMIPQGLLCTNQKDAVTFYNNRLLDILQINKNEDIEQQLKKYTHKLGIGMAAPNRPISLDANGKTTIVSSTGKAVIDKGTDEVHNLFLVEQDFGIKQLPGDREYELFTFDQIIGKNEILQEAKSLALSVAKTSVPVLLLGENGTGKEMFAQAIHQSSTRRDKPFIAINCGALPSEIVESELFGYEEGAFTGALKGGKIGKIEAASGGTLFLDEIESMPPHIQIKLLRVLATGRLSKIGGIKEVPVDFRIISATKKELLKEADQDLFREDLYYRISTFVIKLPSLRERKDDIKLLAQYFISKFCFKYGHPDLVTEESFLDALTFYFWRGNVRELEHTLERAIILLGSENNLTIQYLPKAIQEVYQYSSTKELLLNTIEQGENKQGLMALAEEIIIEHALKTFEGNVSAAAEVLGINRRTIYNKLQEHPKLRTYIN